MNLDYRLKPKRAWTRFHRSSWPLISRIAALYRRLCLNNVTLITVIGSFGKTTTTSAIRKALNQTAHSARPGNIGSYLAKEVLMIPRSSVYSVLEAAIDGPGQMAAYSSMIRPDIVVVTAVGSEHHRSLKSLETTRYEKSRMLSGLTPQGIAILNGDDPNVRWMESQTPARVVTCGFGPDNDLRVEESVLRWPTRTKLTISFSGRRESLDSNLIGRHMVYPILASVAVGTELGIPFETVKNRLSRLQPAPMRLQPVQLDKNVILLRDEFKAAEETVEKALETLEEIPAKRRIVVIGEISEPVGSLGPLYRKLGEKMGRFADRVIVVGHNFQRYSAGARKIGKKYGIFFDAGNSWRKAAALIQKDIQEGDVILIKGRDTQRLDRIALALQGEEVNCRLKFCQAVARCQECPVLGVVVR